MARVRKPKPTLESVIFVTPEQKLLRFLLSNPTSTFSPRVLASKLKGVRGLGGAEGLARILQDLQEVGLVQFVNHNREVSLCDDILPVQLLKIFSAICDLEGLQSLLQPVSSKGILFGNRAIGNATSDCGYDLLVVSDSPTEVEKLVTSHPLGKRIELLCKSQDEYQKIEATNPQLARDLEKGITMWGSSW